MYVGPFSAADATLVSGRIPVSRLVVPVPLAGTWILP